MACQWRAIVIIYNRAKAQGENKMKKVIEKIINRAKLNLKMRDANNQLAEQERELHHWKNATMYEGFADQFQSAFMEDVNIYGAIQDLDWMDACKELHRLADNYQ